MESGKKKKAISIMSEKKSLAKNYIFNFIKTLMSVLFPVITFAYASRILGADGVGKVNFSKSIITYFSMIAVLGMQYYGTREAAKLRDDVDALSKYVHEMLMINGFMTLIALGLLFTSITLVPKLQDYRILLTIGSVSVVLQSMGMEWFYQALENYEYIAVRSVLFQFIALVGMFVFVKDASDVVAYMAISIFASYGSYVLNFINIRKYVNWKWYGGYEFRKHVKPLLLLFAMALSIHLYTVLDSTMLGFLQNDASVGRYTAAVKINKTVNSLITSVGVVLIPRLSYYIGKKEIEKIKLLIDKSYNYVFMLSVPAFLGLFLLSDEIILLFSGADFASAAKTMRILTLIVLVIPFSVVTNTQTFVPMGKENLILISTFTGALINISCNAFLIPEYAENGAAVATVVAETAIACICFYNISKFISMKKVFRVFWQYIVAALPIIPIKMFLDIRVTNMIMRVAVTVVLAAAIYFTLLMFMKNPYMYEVRDTVFKWMKGKRK